MLAGLYLWRTNVVFLYLRLQSIVYTWSVIGKKSAASPGVVVDSLNHVST